MQTNLKKLCFGGGALLAFAIACGTATTTQQLAKPKPKAKPNMGDFIGLNTHTVQFKTDLYRPVTRSLRNYHPMEWDFNDSDPSKHREFPVTHNQINWMDLYGKWKKEGFTIDASAQFESMDPDKWKDIPKDAYQYGESFAKYFGSTGQNVVETIEVGNEPMKFSEAQYRSMFENMAKGVRKGDPKMLISTCAVALGKADQWSKDVEILKGLEPLYDILNVHSYAFSEGWPTWKRSFPEDPKINYLKQIQGIIDWRDKNAPGKQVWVTEFGWDSSTKKSTATGEEGKWVGNSDTEQARYIVRSYLVFSGMEVDRAHLYWFDDNDAPSLHGSSGLTRHFQPKPSYHSTAHLLKTLEGYRFSREVVKRPGEVYAYEYVPVTGSGDRIWAVWSPTGSDRKAEVTLPSPKGKVVRAERMPLKEGAPEKVSTTAVAGGGVKLQVDESPTYLWVRL
ncbi:hypothetical protein EON81_10320 [bacterium]|nr:MAG: hypothetical protein EON81_10320 [bacterium]